MGWFNKPWYFDYGVIIYEKMSEALVPKLQKSQLLENSYKNSCKIL